MTLSILEFPTEIRILIFKYYYIEYAVHSLLPPRDALQRGGPRWSRSPTELLLTCRLFYSECAPIMLSYLTLYVDNAYDEKMPCIRPNPKLIKRPKNLCYVLGNDHSIDKPPIWRLLPDELFANISRVSVIMDTNRDPLSFDTGRKKLEWNKPGVPSLLGHMIKDLEHLEDIFVVFRFKYPEDSVAMKAAGGKRRTLSIIQHQIFFHMMYSYVVRMGATNFYYYVRWLDSRWLEDLRQHPNCAYRVAGLFIVNYQHCIEAAHPHYFEICLRERPPNLSEEALKPYFRSKFFDDRDLPLPQPYTPQDTDRIIRVHFGDDEKTKRYITEILT